MKAVSLAMFLIGVLLLLAACVAMPPPTVAPSATTPSVQPIKIGAIYNLTGAQAPLGAPSANGADLAAREINKSGGLLGRPLELVLYDGKTDPATISGLAAQLIESDKVAAMLGFSDSDQVLAAAPFAAQGGLVFVTSGATSPKLPEQVPGYLYLACFGDNVQAAAGAEYAYNTLKARTAYVLVDKSMEYTQLLGKYFKERFKELGGNVVLTDEYQAGQTDMSGQIARVMDIGTPPDLLFIAAGPDDAGAVVKQFREAGVNQPILGGDAYDSPLLVETASKAAENVYFTTHGLMDPAAGSDAVKNFMAAYQAEYGHPPESAFAALGYDTVKLIGDAIRRAGSDDPQAIREALAQTRNLPGVTGSITYEQGNRIPRKAVTVVRVRDGKFTLAEEVIPAKVPAP